MEFEFPIYPFIWDYSDMYNLIEYESKILDLNEFDENIKFMFEKFPNSQVVEFKQTINSRESVKNLNIHTWYLSKKKIFETTGDKIKIITDSRTKFKSNVNCFIFDPNDVFDNLKIDNKDNKENKENSKQFSTICIIKNNKSIIPELIPSLYIHTHNIKGIFRFSPNDNNKIHIRDEINDGIFYIQLDRLIVKFIFEIKS